MLTTLAITLLNPHVYLDTLVIIGGIGGTLSREEKHWFLLGSVIASFVRFIGLDSVMGVVMCWVATGLVVFVYQSLFV
jgi:L-lysine exporter family protein LysE/ArgO